MCGAQIFPEPKEVQEIRDIIARHRERISNINIVVSIVRSLADYFNNFVRRELSDIRKQLIILEPWFELELKDEEERLKKLEGEFEDIRSKLNSLLNDAEGGRIKNLEEVDLSIITEAFRLVSDVEKLWGDVERWSRVLLRQAETLRRWLQEMLPSQEKAS